MYILYIELIALVGLNVYTIHIPSNTLHKLHLKYFKQSYAYVCVNIWFILSGIFALNMLKHVSMIALYYHLIHHLLLARYTLPKNICMLCERYARLINEVGLAWTLWFFPVWFNFIFARVTLASWYLWKALFFIRCIASV